MSLKNQCLGNQSGTLKRRSPYLCLCWADTKWKAALCPTIPQRPSSSTCQADQPTSHNWVMPYNTLNFASCSSFCGLFRIVIVGFFEHLFSCLCFFNNLIPSPTLNTFRFICLPLIQSGWHPTCSPHAHLHHCPSFCDAVSVLRMAFHHFLVFTPLFLE